MPKQSADTLIEDLEHPPDHGNRRMVCHLIEESNKLPPSHAEAIRKAVANRKWSTRQLSAVLGKHGITVSFSAIANHRRGVCPCYRKAEDDGA